MDAFLDNPDLFVRAFFMSWRICLWGIAGSLVIGTLIAACRVSPVAPLRAFGTFWVTTFRNTPLTLVLFFVAFGFPQIGINAGYFWFLVLALWLYTSAFVCEAIRSGINAVSPGQAEAARAVGLTFTQTLRHVVLPQAFRAVVPPLGSVLIAMMKNSAIAGLFGVSGDLMSLGRGLIGGQGYAALGVWLTVLVGYLLITLPTGALLAFIERRLAVAR